VNRKAFARRGPAVLALWQHDRTEAKARLRENDVQVDADL